jgi:hypothetical protein
MFLYVLQHVLLLYCVFTLFQPLNSVNLLSFDGKSVYLQVNNSSLSHEIIRNKSQSEQSENYQG